MKKVLKIITNILAILFAVPVALYFVIGEGDDVLLWQIRVLFPWVGLGIGILLILSVVLGRIAKLRVNIPLRIIAAVLALVTAIPEWGVAFTFYGADIGVALFVMIAHAVENKTQTNKLTKLFSSLADAVLVVAQLLCVVIFVFMDKESLYPVVMVAFILAGALMATRGVFGLLAAFKKEEEPAAPEAPVAQ